MVESCETGQAGLPELATDDLDLARVGRAAPRLDERNRDGLGELRVEREEALAQRGDIDGSVVTRDYRRHGPVDASPQQWLRAPTPRERQAVHRPDQQAARYLEQRLHAYRLDIEPFIGTPRGGIETTDPAAQAADPQLRASVRGHGRDRTARKTEAIGSDMSKAGEVFPGRPEVSQPTIAQGEPQAMFPILQHAAHATSG